MAVNEELTMVSNSQELPFYKIDKELRRHKMQMVGTVSETLHGC